MTAELVCVIEPAGGILGPPERVKKCIRGHEYVAPRPPHKPCLACRRLLGHGSVVDRKLDRPNVFERFYSNVTIDDKEKCWPWRGAISVPPASCGYGRFIIKRRWVGAHRFSYELNVGPIPDGLTLDHVKARGCTMRHCVNPSHLEPVTSRVNTMRGDTPAAKNAAKQHCAKGHAYSWRPSKRRERGERICLECGRESQARHRLRKALHA